MPTYPLPENDEQRLHDLYSLDLLDTPEEDEFNSLVELVTIITGCQTSVISLIDKDRQWFKAKVGIEVNETPRNISFCIHTIVHNKMMIVQDASMDDRFRTNPLVTGPLGVRFYAGVPIYSPQGNPVGTICALDQAPKQLTEKQLKALHSIALQATKLLELRKRNKEIATQAQKLLKLEQATLHHHIKQHQEENDLVGYELRENLAQTITAALNYIRIFKSNPQLKEAVIGKMEKLLQNVLDTIRVLSNTISPIDQMNFAGEETLVNLLKQFGEYNGNAVQFECFGDLSVLKAETLAHLYRIVRDQLHSYNQLLLKEEQSIAIHLNIDELLELKLIAKKDFDMLSEERTVVYNSIKRRCEMLMGTACFERIGVNTSMLKVQIPLN